MRMLRLYLLEPTCSTAVQRPGAIERGSVARMAFVPATHRFRADATRRCRRMSDSLAMAVRVTRARATSIRLAPRRSTENLRPLTESGWTCGGGGAGGVGGGGGGGGGVGGGGPGGGGGGGLALTTICADIAWPGIAHSYWKVPAVENAWRKDPLGLIEPESKAPAAVTVCATESLFIQHTVVPGVTVGDDGE
jgi:hypothetical protein